MNKQKYHQLESDRDKVSLTKISKVRKNGKIVVSETIIEASTGEEVEGCLTKQRQVANLAQARIVEQQLVNAREKSLAKDRNQQENGGKLETQEPELHPLIIVCDELLKELKSGNFVQFYKGWNRISTNQAALTYYMRTIVPFMEQYYDPNKEEFYPILPSQIKELFSKKYEEAQRKKNNSGDGDIILGTLTAEFRRSNEIHHYLRKNYASLLLPDINFDVGSGRRISREQQKELHEDVRINFQHFLESEVDGHPDLVLAAVLMWDALLRTAESCAVGEDCVFDINNNHISVHIRYQIEKIKGILQRVKILKSDAGYRQVELSTWGTTMVRRCLDNCQQKKMLIGRSYIVDPNILSDWILDALRQAGLTDAAIAEAEKEFLKHLDHERSNAINDTVSAYILRRDGATRLRNIGIEEPELDYLMGHVNHTTYSVDYLNNAYQVNLAEKLDRYIYPGAAASDNPVVNPISVSAGFNYRSNNDANFEEYVFDVDASVDSIEMVVESSEANAPVVIIFEDELGKTFFKVEREACIMGKLADSMAGFTLLGERFPSLVIHDLNQSINDEKDEISIHKEELDNDYTG